MKALEWERILRKQRREHGKSVFTMTELANIAQSSAQVLNVELGRLVKRGVMARYAHGRYGLAEELRPEELVEELDSGAYITGFYGLFHHNLVTQVPVEVMCFTNRRHNRSRVRDTAAGKFVFVCVSRRIYAPPGDGKFAPPEQALCDYVYLLNREGLRAESLVTFRNLERLDKGKLREVAARYPKSLVEALKRILPQDFTV